MKEAPISVAISALINNNKILLIKRTRGDYVGLLSLPGGKIEKHEHLSVAAVREILEESGIKSNFKSHLALVSEHLVEDGIIMSHLLLHVCELIPESTVITNSSEGELKWYDMDTIEELKEQIIPSDFLMIEKIIKRKESNYYDCVIEKIGEDHILRKFE